MVEGVAGRKNVTSQGGLKIKSYCDFLYHLNFLIIFFAQNLTFKIWALMACYRETASSNAMGDIHFRLVTLA